MKQYIVIAALLLAACTQGIQDGDTAHVTYIGTYQNGTVFDSNDPANKELFSQFPDEKFRPILVKMGNSGTIPGFEQALYGMREGQEKTVTVPAKDAYGSYREDRVRHVPKEKVIDREIAIPREQVIPVAQILQYRENVTPGKTYETHNFKYTIEAVDGDMALVYILHSIRRPLELPGLPWTSSHVRGNDTELVYRHDPEDGTVYETNDGVVRIHVMDDTLTLESLLEVGNVVQTNEGLMRVTGETDTSFILDGNHPLAGYTLVFTVRVDGIDRGN